MIGFVWIISKINTTKAQCGGTYCSVLVRCGSYPTILPRSDGGIAVGYDNTTNTILLFGGWSNLEQFTTFNIDSATFNDEGISYIGSFVTGYGEYYTQLNDILYVVRDNYMTTINTITRLVTQHTFPNGAELPTGVKQIACLESLQVGNNKYVVLV